MSERRCLDCKDILPTAKGRPRLRCLDCAKQHQTKQLEEWKQVFKARHKGKRCKHCGSLLRVKQT